MIAEKKNIFSCCYHHGYIKQSVRAPWADSGVVSLQVGTGVQLQLISGLKRALPLEEVADLEGVLYSIPRVHLSWLCPQISRNFPGYRWQLNQIQKSLQDGQPGMATVWGSASLVEPCMETMNNLLKVVMPLQPSCNICTCTETSKNHGQSLVSSAPTAHARTIPETSSGPPAGKYPGYNPGSYRFLAHWGGGDFLPFVSK